MNDYQKVNSMSSIEISGIRFYKDKMDAILKSLKHGINGDFYYAVAEYIDENTPVVDGEHIPVHFYAVCVSENRPATISNSTGSNGYWTRFNRVISSDAMDNSQAFSFEIKDIQF